MAAASGAAAAWPALAARSNEAHMLNIFDAVAWWWAGSGSCGPPAPAVAVALECGGDTPAFVEDAEDEGLMEDKGD